MCADRRCKELRFDPGLQERSWNRASRATQYACLEAPWNEERWRSYRCRCHSWGHYRMTWCQSPTGQWYTAEKGRGGGVGTQWKRPRRSGSSSQECLHPRFSEMGLWSLRSRRSVMAWDGCSHVPIDLFMDLLDVQLSFVIWVCL